MPVHFFGLGYRYSFEEVIRLTDSQVTMLSHAAWAAAKREEIRREFESTCEACGEERVVNKVCQACDRKQAERSFDPDSVGIEIPDTVTWDGVTYRGDEEENAFEKFKRDDPVGFMAYNNHVLVRGMRMDADEEARKRGMYGRRR